MSKTIIRSTTIPQSLDSFCKGVLRELSSEYNVIALSSPGEALNVIEQREGVRTIAVPMERHISLLKDLRSLFSLIRVFRRERPDMVHSMTPKAGLLCMLAAWLTRIPVRVHTFTGLVFPTTKGFLKRILMLTDRITCACATHIIPEGEGVKNDLINNKITRKPLNVLGYGNVRGIDMEYYSRRPEVEERADAIKNDNMLSFLYVGRIVRDKGIEELISAFCKLNDEYPRTRLFLVGDFDNDLDPIGRSTKSLIQNNNNIIYVGRKKGTELLAYYAASDCFVLPSYREGFPNVVLEAGAMGLPCIVTDINGSREIIIDGYNGIIIPSGNSDALFKSMKEMVDNPTLRSSMASVSRLHIESHYEQSFVRQCLYNFYRSVL